MSWRRWAFLGTLAFLAFTLVHAFLPYRWVAALTVPAGAPAQEVTYHCGAPWGSGYVHGPARNPSPGTLKLSPCEDRTRYQVLDGVDAVIGASALVFLGRHRIPLPAPE